MRSFVWGPPAKDPNTLTALFSVNLAVGRERLHRDADWNYSGNAHWFISLFSLSISNLSGIPFSFLFSSFFDGVGAEAGRW